MNVQSILKQKSSEVSTIEQHAAIQHAARIMTMANIGALVVTSGDKVVGMLMNRDIVRAFARHGWGMTDLRVMDVMHPAFVSVAPEDKVKQVMAQMTRQRITHMPVIVSGRLAGIISIGDVVKHALDELELETNVLRDAYIAVH